MATSAGEAGAGQQASKRPRTDDGHLDRFPDLCKILDRDSPFENSTGSLPMGKFEPGAKVCVGTELAWWSAAPAHCTPPFPPLRLERSWHVPAFALWVLEDWGVRCVWSS